MAKYVWGIVIAAVVLLGGYAIYAVIDTIISSRADARVENRMKFEKAYFEGQRDALDGDIRIRKIDNRHYVWVKSPWLNDSLKPFADTISVIPEYRDSSDFK